MPNFTSMNFVRMVVGASGPATYRMDLHVGAGLTGLVLGSTPAYALSTTREFVTFEFATPIPLVPRNIYTFELVRETGAGTSLLSRVSFGDRYAEGAIYGSLPGAVATPLTDFDFVEGLTTVPEPASLAALGGVGLVAFRRRRRA